METYKEDQMHRACSAVSTQAVAEAINSLCGYDLASLVQRLVQAASDDQSVAEAGKALAFAVREELMGHAAERVQAGSTHG